jgi:predicted enzyme involved in methoxymalonyl-ACP biosynthesis
VFARGAEPFILRGLIAIARERGLGVITGEYIPTAKNGVVAGLYAKLGFRETGGGCWRLDLADADPALLETAIAADLDVAEAA